MKKLLRIVLVLVVVIVILLAVGLVLIDQIARSATEKGVGHATGVPTTLRSMDVSLLAGRVQMSDMTLANPAEFTTSPFIMRSGDFDVDVETASLFDQTIRVEHFTLDGLELNIEQRLKGSNVSAVVDNLKRLSGPRDQPDPDAKKVRVDRVVIRNVVARFYLPSELGAREPVEVQLPEIVLQNVASEDAGGVAISELTRRLLAAVLAAVAEKAQGVVPPEVLALLNSDVGELTAAIGAKAADLVNQAKGQAIGRVREQATQAVEQGVRERMKGILDGPK